MLFVIFFQIQTMFYQITRLILVRDLPDYVDKDMPVLSITITRIKGGALGNSSIGKSIAIVI